MRKVIPITSPATTLDKLVRAVGRELAENGYNALSAESLARRAGVDASIIHRRYGGLGGVVSAFGASREFWPDAAELMAGGVAELEGLTPEAQIALFFKRYLAALRTRRLTLEILAWEVRERTWVTRLLEDVRVRTALEFFEELQGDIPDEADLTALVAVMAGAVNYLAVRSRVSRHFGGLDLTSDKGWRRVERAIDLLMAGAIKPA